MSSANDVTKEVQVVDKLQKVIRWGTFYPQLLPLDAKLH